MSAGSIDNKCYSRARLKALYGAHPALRRWMEKPYEFVAKYHVPYVGGIHCEGDPVYGDHRLKYERVNLGGRVVDIRPVVAAHERMEWWLVTHLGMSYDEAHVWANTAERAKAEEIGVQYGTYNDYIDGHVDEIEGAPLKNLAPGLAKYPYRSDKKIMRALAINPRKVAS